MSVIGDTLGFLDGIGLYDVILPFLLVFTLVFGILEKSKILGTEKVGKDTYTRKNLNAMVAFVTGFLVVASAQLVAMINNFVAMSALVLVILVMFMLLVGSFYPEQGDEGLDLTRWRGPLTAVIIIALSFIFLYGIGWLDNIWFFILTGWNTQIMGAIILFLIVVGFMWYLTKSPKDKKDKSDS